MARVIGRIWATSKYPDLEGAAMQLIQPLTCEQEPAGAPFAAVDTIGAGPGELVLYVTAYEAVIPYPKDLVPIDASIIGIVDSVEIDRPLAPPKGKAGRGKTPRTRKASGRKKPPQKKKKSG